MSKVVQVSKSLSYQTELRQTILEVRYTDMEEEKRLCKLLLEVSEAELYFYGSAFANVYLVDAHLALGEYSSCGFYLLRASFLCKEYAFDDLMLMLCNFAGLYYQKLNDDQTALSYFIEGKKLAEKLGDNSMLGKIYNNLGYSFGRCDDLETAREYFQLAFDTVKDNLSGDNKRSAISYLSNLAEACKYLGDTEGSKNAFERCVELGEDNLYSYIRLECSKCSYYAATGNIDKCIGVVDKLLGTGLLEVEDQFFICDMVEGLFGNMMALGENKRAERLLDVIEGLEYNTSLSLQYRIQCLRIQYWEGCKMKEKLKQAYKDYYEIEKKVAAIEDEASAQSILSKMQINQAVLERESMMKQRQDLENMSQLDELTGLYNRRYFNKLISKLTNADNVDTLGFIMLDVDYFKQFNDFYGHFKGDDALRAVSDVLSSNKCDGIHASRYGGDEFVCICVNISDDGVKNYCGRIIEDLKERAIPHEKNTSCGLLTISIGYCNEKFDANINFEEVMDLADKALYEVKKSKRGKYKRKGFKLKK